VLKIKEPGAPASVSTDLRLEVVSFEITIFKLFNPINFVDGTSFGKSGIGSYFFFVLFGSNFACP
jgi:hypothetical protein